MVGMKNATLMLYRTKRGAKARFAPAFMQYTPAAIMKRPASPWQRDRTFCAWMRRSATMPMRVGMKMETMPCIAKNHLICGPRPALPR